MQPWHSSVSLVRDVQELELQPQDPQLLSAVLEQKLDDLMAHLETVLYISA